MYWSHFHPFGFIFFIIIVGFLITNFMIIKRFKRNTEKHTPHEALIILETRLAKGEITPEEFTTIRETLRDTGTGPLSRP